jgi:molybdopterin/thiamine biosynthesis adenylyltransferase
MTTRYRIAAGIRPRDAEFIAAAVSFRRMPDHPRYHRQTLLPDFTSEAQARLAQSSVAIVGCGALGCASADLLVRAGVGAATLIDRDIVELTNLQRQSLYDERDATDAMPKAEAAKRRLTAVNSEVTLHAVVADLTADNAERTLADASVLVDGTDNFDTRFLLNDLAVRRGIPYVYGGAVGTRGMAMTVLPPAERDAEALPCLRCLFPEPPPPGSQPTCDTAGVLGPVVAMVGAYQAGEALKLLINRTDLVLRSLLDFDPWNGDRRRLPLAGARDPDCPCCARRRFEFLSGERAAGTAALCGRDAVQVSPRPGQKIDLAALAQRLAPAGDFRLGPFTLAGTLNESSGAPGTRLTIFRDGRALVQGTTDPTKARTLYDRLIGG